MIAAGLGITIAGFLIAVASLPLAGSTSGRLILVVLGIAVSLIGILGVLNPAYTKNAVWKK